MTSSCGSFFSCGEYSPTATSTPSLRPLIPSDSLMRFQSIQVHHNHSEFFFSNGGGKTIPSGGCSHTFGSSYTNSANKFFFFRLGRPLHNVQSLIFLHSNSKTGNSLRDLQSSGFPVDFGEFPFAS
jgi:hypothetical protein